MGEFSSDVGPTCVAVMGKDGEYKVKTYPSGLPPELERTKYRSREEKTR